MQRFAFCAIRPSITGTASPGATLIRRWGQCHHHVSSHQPPSWLEREGEEEWVEQHESQRLWLFRKEEKEGRENRETNVRGCVFSFLGGRKRKESLWIWLSHYWTVWLECEDIRGSLCVVSNPRAQLQRDPRRHFRAWSVRHFSRRVWRLDSRGHCGCCERSRLM